MYQFGYEKKYRWTEYFARGSEVRSYLEHVATTRGVLDHVEFGRDVASAEWDEQSSTWILSVRRPDGSVEERRANVILSAAGLFGAANELRLDGISTFTGEIVHSTRWPEDLDLTGRRVAIFGNGSTGVQMLKPIAEQASHVDVYQRSAQWIAPRPRYGHPVSRETQWLLRSMPYYWNWYTYSTTTEGLGAQDLQEYDAKWQAGNGGVNPANDALRATMLAYIASELDGREDLIRKVTPRHLPMARRLIVDNGWYASLRRQNVDLITDAVESVTETGIRTVDGTTRDVDVIVAATGFQAEKYLHPATYRGRGGVDLEQWWESGDGARAYLSLTMPQFPNLFVLYGPSGQPRAGALVAFIEGWVSYSVKAVVALLEAGASTIEVREDAFAEYNTLLDAENKKIVWGDPASRANNYYVNKFGRPAINAPWRVEDYYARLARADFSAYDFA